MASVRQDTRIAAEAQMTIDVDSKKKVTYDSRPEL